MSDDEQDPPAPKFRLDVIPPPPPAREKEEQVEADVDLEVIPPPPPNREGKGAEDGQDEAKEWEPPLVPPVP